MWSNTVFEDAIEKFGIENQMIVAIEEFSEITKELSKRLRQLKKTNVKNIGDIKHEICDSYIVLEQIKRMFFDSKEEFEIRYEERIANLIKIVLDIEGSTVALEYRDDCPYDKHGSQLL